MRGQTNLAVYHSWYKNIQEGTLIPGTATEVTANAASASITGEELEETFYPVEWFRLSGFLDYIDAKYTSWIENAICGSRWWMPQCAALSPLAPVVIDHAHGSVTVNGQTYNGRPDLFANAPRVQWSIQPALLLRSWINQDVVISANIYHKSEFADQTSVSNNTTYIGLTPLTESTIYGVAANGWTNPGYTVADLRVDWNEPFDRAGLSLALAVTNVTDNVYRLQSASAFEISGASYSLPGDPRFWYLSATYKF
jgi:outer membrane receptor protein involved in Fe transport